MKSQPIRDEVKVIRKQAIERLAKRDELDETIEAYSPPETYKIILTDKVHLEFDNLRIVREDKDLELSNYNKVVVSARLRVAGKPYLIVELDNLLLNHHSHGLLSGLPNAYVNIFKERKQNEKEENNDFTADGGQN